MDLAHVVLDNQRIGPTVVRPSGYKPNYISSERKFHEQFKYGEKLRIRAKGGEIWIWMFKIKKLGALKNQIFSS